MGHPYIRTDGITSSFDTSWQRAMKKALKQTSLETSFTEHDICAKTASDVDTVEQAAKLRGHLNTNTTDKVYRRKPETVISLKRSK
mgnify:FL=1